METITKDVSWETIDDQREVIADLLDSLDEGQWQARSLCTAWTVRDVGAHLSLAAKARLGEVVRPFFTARGNFDAAIRDATIARARRPIPQILEDLRGIRGSRRLAPGTMWRDPLLDILVHGQDIARPLGIRLDAPPEPVRTAAEWAWQRRFPFFPARRLAGVRLVADDIEWERGSGAPVHGPIMSLLLLSTGRPAGLVELSGPGVDIAAGRLQAH